MTTTSALERTTWDGRLDRWSDRLNPIVVKEVRQALRGKFFQWTFWATISLASLVIVIQLLSAGAGGIVDGRKLFGVLFGCLVVAVHGLVPLWAYFSMSSEWEEGTYDLLVLSNLRPWRIVTGKLFAAGVQAMLYYTAFLPFLAFAFAAGGIDALSVAFVFSASLVFSLLSSVIALDASTLARQRLWRMILLVGLFAILSVGCWASGFAAYTILTEPALFVSSEFWLAVGAMLTIGLTLGAFAACLATARISHPEENVSTPSRVVALLAVLGLIGWLAFARTKTSTDTPVVACILSATGFPCLFLLSVVWTTEADTLSRRVAAQVPTRVPALLVAPFLPGGGRGVLFSFLLHLLLACGVYGSVSGLPPASVGWLPGPDGATGFAFALAAYSAIYLFIPGAIVSRAQYAGPRARLVARLVILGVLAFGMAVPTLILGLSGSDFEHSFRHPFTPVEGARIFLEQSVEPAQRATYVGGLALFVIVGLFANAPRIVRAVTEVREAAGRRRAQRLASGNTTEPPLHAAPQP
ncbi:MAG: hypothetical protein JNJ88_17855 [Planctomycetes bacterium]|nr:hypothetical protein [Planctomycetota bacterium]